MSSIALFLSRKRSRKMVNVRTENSFVKPDIREVESREFLRYDALTFALKTTRAGMTTNAVRTFAMGDKVVIVYPTIAIGAQTVAYEVNRISEMLGNGRPLRVVNIPGNKDCPLNQKMIADAPLLDYMATLPLYDKCGDCELFEDCPVVKVLKGDYDIITITYPKLSALVSASYFKKGTAWLVLEELMKCKTVILDESHVLELGRKADIELYNTRDGYAPIFNPKADLGDSDTLSSVLDAYRTMYLSKNIREALDTVVEKLNSKAWNEKFTRVKVGNPLLSFAIADKPKQMERYVKATRELITLGKMFSAIMLKEEGEGRDEAASTFASVLALYDILTVCSSQNLNITTINDKGVYRVLLSAVDNTIPDNIRTFVDWMLSSSHTDVTIQNSVTFEMEGDTTTFKHSTRIPGMIDSEIRTETESRKRIIMTTATPGKFKSGFLDGLNVCCKYVLFGEGGDPMRTNEKMFIIADKYTLGSIGRNSRYKRQTVIFNQCKEILDKFGIDNCKIIAMNIEQHNLYKDMFEAAGYVGVDVTYYVATDTVGVSSDRRVIIALGKADKPSTSYDAFADDEVESKEIRLMRTHQDTWQAWSRAKDPQSECASIVFALGVSYWECCNVVTWGAGREIVTTEGKRRYEVKVDEDLKVSIPNVLETSGFEDMMRKAVSIGNECGSNSGIVKPSEEVQFVSKYSCLPVESTFLGTSMDVVKALVNRTDFLAMQRPSERIYSPAPNTYTDRFLEFHLKGEVTLASYALDKYSNTRSGTIDIDSHKPGEDVIAEDKKRKLIEFCERHGIPYFIDGTPEVHSYHFRFLFKPCTGYAAHSFLKGIVSAIDSPATEVFPGSATIGIHGLSGLVRLPWGKHQLKGTRNNVCISGDFVSVRNFTGLNTCIIDISSFEAPEKPTETQAECSEPIPLEVHVTPSPCPVSCSSTEFDSQVEFAAGNHDEGYIRPCMRIDPETQFVHVRSHFWVKSMVFEYLQAGYTQAELQEMFVNQKGYDAKKTAFEIAGAATGLKKSATCKKIKEWISTSPGCGVSCAHCSHGRKWKSVSELKAERVAGKKSPSFPSLPSLSGQPLHSSGVAHLERALASGL